MDYLITEGTLLANSEAIGEISILKMCSYPELCVVKKEKVEEDNSGTGYEDGQCPFVLHNHAVLRHKTNDKTTHFRLLVQLQQLAKQSDRHESCYKCVACF